MHQPRPPAPKSRTRVVAKLLVLRLRRVGLVFAVAFSAAMVGIYLAERSVAGSKIHTLFDALWFAVVTLSTVGYGDVYPTTAAGRLVAAGFILFTLTTIGLLLSAINEAILEAKRMEDKGLIGSDMTGHVVVCGYGPVAQTAILELLASGRRVAVLCEREEEVERARSLGDRNELFVSLGDLTVESLRSRVNVEHATTAVVATDDDARNIIGSLNVRALNREARIIVAVRAPELRQTLIASGVTYVASPFELSGRLVASAAFEPEVAAFVEDILSGVDEGFDMQQYPATSFDGKSIREIRDELEKIDGPLLVGIAVRDGARFRVEPHPRLGAKVAREDYLIVLASDEQADRFRARFGVDQGR